jgi:predicted transcriptional regulator
MSKTKHRRTLKARNEPAEETREEFRKKVEALEKGEEVDNMHVLNLTDEQLQRLASTKNIELIRAITEHEPSSINELADALNRDYKQVHRNVKELEEMGVIDFEQEGRSKRPVFGYDEIDIQISL